MYTSDWTSKPNALVYNRLLFREWWTNEEGVTDENGSVTLPVYRGDHQVVVWGPEGPIASTTRVTEPGVVTVSLK